MDAELFTDSIIANDFDFDQFQDQLTQTIISIMITMHNGDCIYTEDDKEMYDEEIIKSLLNTYRTINIENEYTLKYSDFEEIFKDKWIKAFFKEMDGHNKDVTSKEVLDFTDRNYGTCLEDLGDFSMDKNITSRLATLAGHRDAKRCKMMQKMNQEREAKDKLENIEIFDCQEHSKVDVEGLPCEGCGCKTFREIDHGLDKMECMNCMDETDR
jgi:hypothetical protein